jgi:uncharacterized protein (AIM24 family)
VLGFPYNRRNFGVLEVSDVEANIFLYKRGGVEYTGIVNLATGSLKTSMAALAGDAAPKPSVQRAQAQRRRALTRLRATR